MEDIMDELYGDLGQEHQKLLPTDTMGAFDEDSVDIYSGLESPSPQIKSNTERNCTFSQQNLKSMDLYEEIITEEQQERQASYDELRTRYSAAQNQVEELLQRLQQVETQNTKLNTENSQLRKNICALLKTAKIEVARKDEEINRLNHSFRPGRNPAAYRQSQDCQRNQISTRINPPGPSLQRKPQVPTSLTPKGPSQPCQPPGPRRDGLVQDLHKHLQKNSDVVQASVSIPTSDATVFRPPLPDETVLGTAIPDNTILRPPLPDNTILRPPLPDEIVFRPPLPDKPVLRTDLPDDTVLRPPLPVISNVSGVDSEAPVRQRDSPVSNFSKDTVNRHLTREHSTSDHSKQTKHREGRGHNTRLSEQRSKKCPDQESHSNERNRSHKSQKDSGNYDSRTSKSRYSSSNIAIHRRSGRAKSPASNISDYASSDRTYKDLTKESPDVDSFGSRRHDKELKIDKEGDRHRHAKDISFKKQSNQCSFNGRPGKSLHHKRSTSPMRDHQRLEDRRIADEIAKEKNVSGERSSKRSTCSDRGKDMNNSKTKEVDLCSLDDTMVSNLDGCKVREAHEGSNVLPAEAKLHDKSSVEKNSSNKKLSFMETLNLTLSPVKKPSNPAESMEHNKPSRPTEAMEQKKPSKPAEAMLHNKPSKPAEAMVHNKPSKPAEAMVHNKPSKPAETMEHNKSKKPAEAMEHNRPSKPAEVMEHNKPSKPAEAMEHNKPKKPAEAMEHNKPSKPAEAMVHNKPSKPAETMEHNKPSKPAEAMEHNKPSKPAKAMEHNKPSKPAEAMVHNKPSKPAEAKEHNKPCKPAEAMVHNKPCKPAEPMEHNKPSKPAEAMVHNKPSKPAEAMEHNNSKKPAEAMEHNKPSKPAEVMEHNKPSKPAEAMEHNKPSKPAEAKEHNKPCKPAEAMVHNKPCKPVEAMEHNKLSKPAEAMEHNKPSKPAEAMEHNKPSKPAEAMEHNKPSKPAEAMVHNKPSKPAEAMVHNKLSKPAEAMVYNKPRKPAEAMEQNKVTAPEVPEDQSTEDEGQPDLEELIVLDEINSTMETEESEDPVVQPSLETQMPIEPVSIESGPTDKALCQDCDKVLAETTVAKEELKSHLEVVDSTVQDSADGRTEIPEATVDQMTESNTQEPLKTDCATLLDCDSILKRLENCDSENVIENSEDFTAATTASTTDFENCRSYSNKNTELSCNRLTPEHSTADSEVVAENCVDIQNRETPIDLVSKRNSLETVSQEPPSAARVGSPAIQASTGNGMSESLQPSLLIEPEGLQPLPASVISNDIHKKSVTEEVLDVSRNAVSSTICIDVIPEICITDVTTDVTGVLMTCEKEKPLEEQSSLMSSSIGVSKVSSTTCEVTPSEQYKQDLEHTPKKSLHSEKSYRENEEENIEPSSSIPMAHDEDSMMLTLSSLKIIPNVISPLTSPVRPTRKSQQPCPNTLAYAKSLCKVLSSTAVDPDSEKLEVTKENKIAGCTAMPATKEDVDGKSDCPSSTEKELEEGEIVSESEGEETTVTQSPPTKTVRPTSNLKNQPSDKLFPRLSKNLAKEKLVNEGDSEAKRITMTSSFKSPTSNKTRYKTVQPQLPKYPLSTVEEVMDIFAKIRKECRKKYMKLHSVFSKRTFSGVMGMSLDSFIDFVDCVHLTKLCNEEDILKVKLKNIVKSVLIKLTDNGIVNRIFDQQPLDMKSKLWEFVDSQLDFLFKDIQITLRGVCISSKGNPSSGAVNDRNFSGNKVLKQTVRSPKQPTRSPKQPTRSPKQPTRSPKQPSRSPKQPSRSQKQPSRSQKQPSRSQKQPSRSQKQPSRSQKQPLRSQKQPSRSPKQPARSPRQPARSPKSSVSNTSRLRKPQQTESLTRTFTPKRPPEELSECVQPNIKRSRFQTVPPCRTGLGRGKSIKMSSEVENTELEPQTSDHIHMQPSTQTTLQHSVESLPSNGSSSAERVATYVRRLSQNGAIHDKSDFEILTEQQASSLTFNLVTDTQMGEIFKCLLQGSDLLETNVSGAENQGWPLGTPRKEGEHFLDLTTPSKGVTPSKLITTWTAISPQKFSSPNSKIKVPVNPALLDESCMLEVPSSLSESRTTPQYGVFSQRSYSILAEDLAVSLTIPSPLKSDNHLSFLHPASGELASAPDSVISAHFSEDALMDGEDAVEQDIHLALDTDNSSGGSSGGGRTSEPSVNPLFHFKPHLPMQAVVMEKSNDHFIVKIRHADSFNSTNPGINCSNLCIKSTNPAINFTNLGNNSSSSSDKFTNLPVNSTTTDIISTSKIVNATSTGIISNCPADHFKNLVVNPTSMEINSTLHVANSTNLEKNSTSQAVKSLKPSSVSYISPGNNSTNPINTCINPGYNSTNPGTNSTLVDNSTRTVNCINQSITSTSKDLNPTLARSPQSPQIERQHGKNDSPKEHSYEAPLSEASPPFHLSCISTSTETASDISEPCLSIVEEPPERDQRGGKFGKKRSKHHVETKAKRAKKEVIPEKSKHKKKSVKSPKGKGHKSYKREQSKVSSPARSTPSPNSLSARNIIIKKGEVVETWTKNEDRDILLSLKMNGSRSDTFSALSEKMNKTPAQIAERFSQLMKLFKKKEKMAS